MIEVYTLNNGIRIITNKIEGVYSLSMGIFVGAGSSYESPKENGISHFIEHVTFKGTNKRSAYDISNDTELIGADINAYTGRNLTAYYIKTTSEHMADAFEILQDVFQNSVYNPQELEKEKSVIIQEINMYQDTPDDLCCDLLMEAYFGENGYGAPILGTEKTVNSFTREDIINYKNKFYTTDSIVISFAGDINKDRAIELVEKYFGDKKPTKSAYKPVINTKNQNKSLSITKEITQAHLCLGLNGVSLTHDYVDLFNITMYILGGGMSSRLFQTVREKLGLCYSIYSYMTAYVDCGFGIIYAGVEKNNLINAYEAILEQLKLLKRDKISDEEFKRSFEQMKSSIVFSQESVSAQMQAQAKRLLLTGKILDFKDRLSKLQKITKSDVNGLIEGFLDIDNIAKAVVSSNNITL